MAKFNPDFELMQRDDISQALLGIGGIGYTICYVLMTKQSIVDRTYAMPLFSLAFNFAWEIVFAIYVSVEISEKVIFTIWGLLDLGMVYAVVLHGRNEWQHAPAVSRHLGKIFTAMLMWWCITLYIFAAWWLDSSEALNKMHGQAATLGLVDNIRVELGFWTALLAQVVLSVMSLAQIMVRETSGGSSYAIWATRFVGSVCGLNLNYLYGWWIWPGTYAYVINPVSVVLMVTWVLADLAYFVFLVIAKRTETVLPTGRKTKTNATKRSKDR